MQSVDAQCVIVSSHCRQKAPRQCSILLLKTFHSAAYLSGGSMGATTALWYSRTSGVGGELPGKCRCPNVSVGLESLLLGPSGVPMDLSGLRSWLPPALLLLLAIAAAAAASAAAASASI